MADALYLFDDARARAWEPFALTRPAGELRFGAFTLRGRAEAVLGRRCEAHLAAAHLAGFAEGDAPPVLAPDRAPAGGRRVFLSSRAVLDWGARLPEGARGPLRVGGTVAGWIAEDGEAPPAGVWEDPASLPAEGGADLPGRLLAEVWELMAGSAAQVATDVAARFPGEHRPSLPPGAYHVGHHALVLGEGVQVEPCVVIDTTAGPVWLDDGVTVRAFTRLAGPAYVGPRSTLLGGAIGPATIGAVCKIRGELADTVCLSYVNKAHDGHIGHAYLGAWVNLGAETTNSDLKNNYGSVRLWTPRGERDTGQAKVGCFLGDHVKTGIGLLLNTGSVIGAGSNVFGSAMPPRYVPPFSWGTADDLTAYRVDRFLEVAGRAMARRDVPLTDALRAQLAASWKRGRLPEPS